MNKTMRCEICGTVLRAEPAVTEPGWIIFHECCIVGDTEQEAIENYKKLRASAHNSEYKQCEHKNTSRVREYDGFHTWCRECGKPLHHG